MFRDIELVGAERMPASGPVIVIANHMNSLIDGGLLLAFLPRIPRFLAASTVWDHRPVAPFMNASGSVKVFRQQDGRAHEGSLEDSFSDAAALLADGGVLAVFPEGRTHDDPALLPFKTGTARIALHTRERHGTFDLPVVPVGIDYEVKNRFRTRACFTFGTPTPVPVNPGAGPGRDGEGVRGATAALRRALSAVAPDFADPDEARAVTLAGEILALEEIRGAGRRPAFSRIVARRLEVRDWLAGAADAAGPAQALRTRLADYAQALAAVGVTDLETGAPARGRALLGSGLALLAGLPLVLVAAVLSGPQMLVLRAVARSQPRDRQLTWMTFGGVVLFALTWGLWALVLGLAEGLAVGAGRGWAVAVAVLIGAPLSARLALPTVDRASQLWRDLRARRRLRRDVEARARLAALRARAVAALESCLAAPDRHG